MTTDAPTPADADAALLRAAIACAERAQRVAEDDRGHSVTAEGWAVAAAELALAAKGVAVPLPARPGK